MKTFLYIILPLCLALPALGQVDTLQPDWVVGVHGVAGLPVGSLQDNADVGFGAMAWAGYMVNHSFELSLKGGYLHFGGKGFEIPFVGVELPAPALNVIPLLLSGKAFLSPPGDVRLYADGDLGLYILRRELSIAGFGLSSQTDNKFGVSPGIGLQARLGSFATGDARLGYTAVFTDGATSQWIGIGLGLEFGLK